MDNNVLSAAIVSFLPPMRKQHAYYVAFVFLCSSISLPLKAESPSTLKSAFGQWFEMGAAIPGSELSDAEQSLLVNNFTNVTPENCLKPGAIEPEEGKFTFAAGDAFLAFAQTHGLKVNGHTLVWHEHCPDWFFLDQGKPADRQLVLQRMRAHITAEVSHYRGKVASWDVVNEAIADGTEYLRNNQWFARIGSDYIAEAFLAAQKADPDAELYYNDYSIEQPDKRAKALRLVHELQAAHVRLDGIGIQGHWQLDHIPYQEIEDAIVAFHQAGIKVMITELDIDVVPRKTGGADVGSKESQTADLYQEGVPAEVLARQAEQYAKLFTLFRQHAEAVKRVTFWGLDDGRSWLNGWPRKRTNYPLLWSRQLDPKPAFVAVIEAAK